MPIYKTRLINQVNVAKNTIVCEFEKPEGFQFKPGQYGTFVLPQEYANGSDLSRRFSLLCASNSDTIRIVTRLNSQSVYKQSLQNLSSNENVKLIGPIGEFTLHENHEIPAVFIAGGVGIAPFYSIISALKNAEIFPEIYLFYGCYDIDEMPFLNELKQISMANNKISLIPILVKANSNWTGEVGYVTETILKKYVPQTDKNNYYICGSLKMVVAIKNILNTMKIEDRQIKLEDFPGY